MFTRKNAIYHQVAYVTNDLKAAIAMLGENYATSGFYIFSNTETPAWKQGEPKLLIALGRVGGMEIELIEPIGKTAPLFKNALNDGRDLQIRFHHTAMRIAGTLADWYDYAASIDLDRHRIVYQGEIENDLRYFYTDEHPRLGHYIEHMWFSPKLLVQLSTAIEAASKI